MYYENFYEIIKKKMESGLCANIVYKGDSVSLKDFMSYVDQKYFESPIEVAYVEGNHYSIYSNKNLGLNIGKEIDKFMLKVISNG